MARRATARQLHRPLPDNLAHRVGGSLAGKVERGALQLVAAFEPWPPFRIFTGYLVPGQPLTTLFTFASLLRELISIGFLIGRTGKLSLLFLPVPTKHRRRCVADGCGEVGRLRVG